MSSAIQPFLLLLPPVIDKVLALNRNAPYSNRQDLSLFLCLIHTHTHFYKSKKNENERLKL